MEDVFGRYQATIRTISGVYSNELMNDDNYNKALNLTKEFEEKSGRRPRIMIAKNGVKMGMIGVQKLWLLLSGLI